MSSALSAREMASYAEHGFLLLKGGLTRDEAAVLRRAGHDVVARRGSSNAIWKTATEVTDQETVLRHRHDMQLESSFFGELLFDPRLVDPAADLMGTPNVQLHHNKFFIKPPENGSPFPMHQDWPFFPHARDSLIAAIIHLDDAPEEKGCVRVVPGSHRAGRVDHLGEIDWYLPTDIYALEDAVPVPAEAGDILFFSCLTVHGSGLNVSDEARTTFLVQMRDPEDPPTVDRHLSPGQGTMLRGVRP